MQLPLFDDALNRAQPSDLDRLRGPTVTIDETLSAYERSLAGARKARNTIQNFLGDIRQLSHLYPRRPLTTFTTAHLEYFVGTLQRDHGLVDKSLTRKITSLKSYFRFLASANIVARDPALRLIYPALQPQLPEILTDEETERLLAVTVPAPLWHALVATLRYAGPKREEALALRRTDIELHTKPPSITMRRRRPSRYNRDRSIQIQPPLLAVLSSYLDQLAGSLLFPLHVRSVQWGLSHYADLAGMTRPVSAQTLRDTFAVAWLRDQIPAEQTVLEQEGRDRYAAVIDEHHRRLLDLLGLAENTGPVAISKYRRLAQPILSAS